MDKERKKYVKEQRKKLVDNPSKFIRENVIKPIWKYWKEQPLHAFGNFIFWIVLYYLLFGGIQAINNDIIYCDSTIDEFDGKLMYVYNDFVDYYNNKASRMELQKNPYDFETGNYKLSEKNIEQFNKDYSMICEYDLERWNNESVNKRINDMWYGFKKIILKRS